MAAKATRQSDRTFGLYSLFRAIEPDDECERRAKLCRAGHRAVAHQRTQDGITLEWVHCKRCEMVYVLGVREEPPK